VVQYTSSFNQHAIESSESIFPFFSRLYYGQYKYQVLVPGAYEGKDL
jgi:hypothetical protein